MRHRRFLYCSLVFAPLFLATISWAQGTDVQVTLGDRPVLVQKSQWVFVEVNQGTRGSPGGGISLFHQILIETPGKPIPKSVEGQSVIWNSKTAREGRIALSLGALTTKVKVNYSDGTSSILIVKINMREVFVKDQGCKEAGILFRATTAIPTFVGTFCEVKRDRVLLSLSLPNEAEADGSTLFEVAGKGERWKTYEISRSNILGSNSQLAKFSFRQDRKALQFEIHSEERKLSRAPSSLEAEPAFRGHLGLGFASLAATTDGGTEKTTAPSLVAEGLSRALFWGLHTYGQVVYAFPTSKASSYSLNMALGPCWAADKSICTLVEYDVIGQDQEVASKSYNSIINQGGVRLLADFGSNSKFRLNLAYGGFGSDFKSTSIAVGYLGQKKAKGWSAFIQMSNQKGTSAGSSFGFEQSSVFGAYAF